MKHTWFFWILMLLLAQGAATVSVPAHAQGEETQWSEPINLSNTLTDSEFPAIAADPAGGVHVVWLESVSNTERAILYTALENGNWTAPIDIVPEVAVGGQGVPSLVADTQGILHLAYLKNDGIAYSQAFAPQAGSAKAWRDPEILVPAHNYLGRFDLAIGSGSNEGLICLVYTVQTGIEGGVHLICSHDSGLTWDAPYTVYDNKDAGDWVNKPHLAIGADGSLHVVWVHANYPETFPPLGVRYAHSADGGLTWRTIDLAVGPYEDPAVSLCAEPEVHVVWSGTLPDRFRFHRWSADYGNTWSETWRNEDGGGLLGYPDLVCDSSGVLHWLTAIDDFTIARDSDLTEHGLYYITFSNQTWSTGKVIFRDIVHNRDYGTNLANVSAAISAGNQIHVIVKVPIPLPDVSYQFDILYSNKVLDSPSLEPSLHEDPLPTLTKEPTSYFKFIDTPAPASLDGPIKQPDTRPWNAVSLGGGAAMLIILLVVGVHLGRTRR